MSLSQIINVSITRNTVSADRVSFGIPIFMTATVPAGFTERVREYTSLTGLTDDGFTASDNAYKAASAFFSQNPNVSKILIGRIDVGDANVTASITAISEENDDWYVLTAETRVQADILALAAYVEARDKKMYFCSTAEADSINVVEASGTDTAKQLKDLAYTKTAHYWHQDAATAFYECSFAGHNLPFDAGSATWSYLQLVGVPAAKNTLGNNLTDTQITNLLDRNSNVSLLQNGVTITREGKVVSGEWIDVIRGIDSLDEDLAVSLFDLLIEQQGGKVPYTTPGLNQVKGVIENVLTQYVDRGFIQDNFRVVMPNIKSIPVADKTNRILNSVTFTAYLQGAVHTITVSGNITYEGV